MILGDDSQLDEFDALLKEKYDLKSIGRLGPDINDLKEVCFLNRSIS